MQKSHSRMHLIVGCIAEIIIKYTMKIGSIFQLKYRVVYFELRGFRFGLNRIKIWDLKIELVKKPSSIGNLDIGGSHIKVIHLVSSWHTLE